MTDKTVLAAGSTMVLDRRNKSGKPAVLDKTETILGKQVPFHAKGTTTAQIDPVIVTCEPCNFGMRETSIDLKTKLINYPVARKYVDQIKPYLEALTDQQIKSMGRLDPSLIGLIKQALTAGEHGLPPEAMPTIILLDEGEKIDETDQDPPFPVGKYTPTGGGVIGSFDASTFNIRVNKEALAYAVPTKFDDAEEQALNELNVIKARQRFAVSLYHEARHAQQYYWMYVYIMNHTEDLKSTPRIKEFYEKNIWPKLIDNRDDKDIIKKMKGKTITSTAMAICIKRMVLTDYLLNLRNYSDTYKAKSYPFEFEDEIPKARQAADDLMNRNVQAPAKKIDVDEVSNPNASREGYTNRPYEEDAFFTSNHVVKLLWSGIEIPTVNACIEGRS